MIVTIDGPAGAGKSSAARELARRLGYQFLDTGAMYRAVALVCLRRQLPITEPNLVPLLCEIQLEMPPGRVILNGEDVSGLIRSQEIDRLVSPVADSPAVRTWLADLQRQIARGRDIVCEGRDQGTIVFPGAECKFFLEADIEERTRRRQREKIQRGETVDFDQLLRMIRERDDRDAARDLAPMKPAGDAIILNSTSMTLEEVVNRMEATVRGRRVGA
jgi:cytidylate kinase